MPVESGSVKSSGLFRSSDEEKPPSGTAWPSGVVLMGNLNLLRVPPRNLIVHMIESVLRSGVTVAPRGLVVFHGRP